MPPRRTRSKRASDVEEVLRRLAGGDELSTGQFVEGTMRWLLDQMATNADRVRLEHVAQILEACAKLEEARVAGNAGNGLQTVVAELEEFMREPEEAA